MRTRPLTRADLPTCADLSVRAFLNDDLYVWLCPHRHAHPADFRAHNLRRLRARFAQPGCVGFVCVADVEDDAEGEVLLGYAFWARVGAKTGVGAGGAAAATRSIWRQRRRRHNAGWGPWVEGRLLEAEERYVNFWGLDGSRDGEAGRVLAREVAAARDLLEGLGEHWRLCVLAVAPEWQRRGVGGLLLRGGLEVARRERLPVGLMSSDEGRGLYAKHGFKVVDWGSLSVENGWVGGAAMVLDQERRWVREVKEGEGIGRGGRPVEVAWIHGKVDMSVEEEQVEY